MNHDLIKQAWAAYALGALDGSDRMTFESHLAGGCPECEDQIRVLGGTASLLAHAARPALPSARLKRRVLSAIGDEGFYFLHARESEWEASDVQSLDVRRLFIDPKNAGETMLVRMLPRVSFRGLPEFADESCYVVDGTLELGGQILGAGDFFRAGTGACGPERTSTQGCVLLVTAAPAVGAAGPPAIVRAHEGTWHGLATGTAARPLAADRARGLQILLVRFAPGTNYTEHAHAAAEELYLLQGDCRCQGVLLGAGDYHRSGAGSLHAVTSTVGGCTMIVIDHNLPTAA